MRLRYWLTRRLQQWLLDTNAITAGTFTIETRMLTPRDTERLTTISRDGALANICGKSLHKNPHALGSAYWQAWRLGWELEDYRRVRDAAFGSDKHVS